MPPARGAIRWAAALLGLFVSLALAGEAPPEPEDREIPPDRGSYRLYEKDFRARLRDFLDPATPLEKRVDCLGLFALTCDERAVPPLVKVACSEKEPIDLRVAILWALGQIGDPRGMVAHQYALAKLYMKDPAWRHPGITIEGQKEPIPLQELCEAQLARLGEAVVGKLAAMVAARTSGSEREPDPKLQTESPQAGRLRAALITLAAVGDRDARAVRALCDVLRADDEYYPWDFKLIAAQALGSLVERRQKQFAAIKADDKMSVKIGEAFIETAIVTDIPEVREIAGWILRKMGWGDKAGERLAAVLQVPNLPRKVRYRTIEALAFIQSKTAADALILQLYDPDKNVRWRAAISLGTTGDPRALPFLRNLTKDPDPMVRGRTVAALGHLEDRGAVPDLIAAMHDREASVRRQAALALGRVGGAAAVPPLLHALKDTSPAVRENAVIALGYVRRASGLRSVADMVADPDAMVRLAAVQVLAQFRNPETTKALLAALGDAQTVVRDAASAAFKDRLSRSPRETISALVEAVAEGKGAARLAALKSLAADYREAQAQKEGTRADFYRRLLRTAESPLAAALIAALGDPAPEARALAGDLLSDYGWSQKSRDLLERVAALAHDTDAKARLIGQRANNYLKNLR